MEFINKIFDKLFNFKNERRDGNIKKWEYPERYGKPKEYVISLTEDEVMAMVFSTTQMKDKYFRGGMLLIKYSSVADKLMKCIMDSIEREISEEPNK